MGTTKPPSCEERGPRSIASRLADLLQVLNGEPEEPSGVHVGNRRRTPLPPRGYEKSLHRHPVEVRDHAVSSEEPGQLFEVPPLFVGALRPDENYHGLLPVS